MLYYIISNLLLFNIFFKIYLNVLKLCTTIFSILPICFTVLNKKIKTLINFLTLTIIKINEESNKFFFFFVTMCIFYIYL